MADPQLDPAEVRVSFGLGVYFNDPREYELAKLYKSLQSPQADYKTQIEDLRKLVDDGKLDDYKKQKKDLYAFCWSGAFQCDGKKPPKSEDLIQHTGRLQIDIDQLDKPRAESEAVRDRIGQDPHIEISHLSPSARGVKAAILIPICATDQEHKRCFTAVQAYIKATYDLDIDKSCKDIRRLCFASYDPDAVINKNAKVLDIEQWLPAEQKKSKSLFDASKHEIKTKKAEVIFDAGAYTIEDSKLDPKECTRKYAQTVLKSAVEDIQTAPTGEKHSTRLERSRLVGGFVAAGHLDEAEALSELIAAALANTDNASAAEKDVRDGFEDGKKSPVDPPPMEEKTSSDLVVKIAKQLPPPTPSDDTTTTDNDDWADPEPLIVKTDPKPYPIESLPPIIKDAVLEVAEFVQAPVPIVASAALAAIATVAQGHFDVRRAEGLEGPISLFCLAIADSGDRKTSAARFSKTIQQHEKNERERLAPEWKKYQGLMDAWESKRQGLKQKLRQQQQKEDPNVGDTEEELVELQQSQPEPPRMPRWQYGDFTIEALGKGIMGWPAAVIESDESGSVFGGYSMREAAMKFFADLNRFWDGKSIHVDRRQSESYRIDGVRLSVSLMIQEPALREFFRQSKQLARGTGFLARFLISWPSSMIGQRFYKDPPKGWPALSAFHQRMEHLLSKSLKIDKQGSLELTTLELDDQARNRWIQFHDDLERELGVGKDLHDVRDIASKTADNAVRIAAIFHAFTSFGQSNRITGSMMSAGRDLALWHLYESQRFFNELAVSPEEANAITLDAWMVDRCRSKGSNEIPRRELQREGPVRKPRDLEQALLFLSSLFRCRAVKDGKKLIIQINPALLEGNDGTQ